MQNKALLVDDVANVLDSFRRNLRGQVAFDVANSGKAALGLMAENHYAVLVTDMTMPDMNGLSLLREVKRLYPDTVRIMLTGNGDQQTAIDAVNGGDVFRFLTKPCSVVELKRVIEAGFHQHSLIMAEKGLLNQTVRGIVSVLAEVLELVNPQAAAHNVQLKMYMLQLAKELKLKQSWMLEPVAELSQLGTIVLPGVLADQYETSKLTAAENELIEQHASLASDLLEKIPRFEAVARNIRYQDKCFNGEGVPADDVKGADIPFGARMLKVVNDFIRARESGLSTVDALRRLETDARWYDGKILLAFTRMLLRKSDLMSVPVSSIEPGMVLSEKIATNAGKQLAREGQVVTTTLKQILTVCIQSGALSPALMIGVYLEDNGDAGNAEDIAV